MEKKGFMNVSFGWIFALIVGAFILFLAIFFAVKLMGIQGTRSGAETSKNLGIVFDPLETSFENSKTTILDIGYPIKITNVCNWYGDFGTQGIKTSQKIFGKGQGGDILVSFENKYIFSREIVEDRKFYVFSRRFDFPFKVTDLIFFIPASENYCFVNAPEEIENLTYKLNLLNIYNISSMQDFSECPVDPKEVVCFGSAAGDSGCTIEVRGQQQGTVKHVSSGTVSYADLSTELAAIFSDPEIYECQMNRTIKRMVSLARLYNDKKEFVKTKGCNSRAQFDLLIQAGLNYGDSGDLAELFSIKDTLHDTTKMSRCQLW